MKKVLLALVAVAFLAIGTSCSKEKDCKCTATAAGVSVDLGTFHIEEGDCSDLETTVVGYSVVSCVKV